MVIALIVIAVLVIIGMVVFLIARGTGQTMLDAAGMTAKFGATATAPEAEHP